MAEPLLPASDSDADDLDRKDRFRCALRWAKSDGQRVVVVVDQLDCAGQPRPHLGEGHLGQGCDFGRVLGDETGELLIG